MGYIDAHVHVWTSEVAAYPLAPGRSTVEMKPRSFTGEELLAHTNPCGVDRIVLVQMSFYGFDNRYMLDTIAQRPETFRGIAVVDYTRDDLAAEMVRLRESGVRGFRVYQLVGRRNAPINASEYEPLCKLAGELDMAVCLLIDPPLLPAAARAIERFSATSFVIDHLGRIGAGKPSEPSEIEALCALAEYPNCYVKVSAFYALGEARPPHEDLIPLIRRVWEVFGAERLMWGSDCPYQVQRETYEESLALVRDRLPFLSDEDRAAILHGTAERVFFK
ncbi:MAG: amidohydrolase family protein [Candidatus Zipacnadales bacterium]